jgi:hypothetical protein
VLISPALSADSQGLELLRGIAAELDGIKAGMVVALALGDSLGLGVMLEDNLGLALGGDLGGNGKLMSVEPKVWYVARGGSSDIFMMFTSFSSGLLCVDNVVSVDILACCASPSSASQAGFVSKRGSSQKQRSSFLFNICWIVSGRWWPPK